MKMTPAQPTTTLRILPGLAALAAAAYLSLPAIASAQASSSSTTPSTGSTVSPAPEVVLDPFTVSTSQDKGYAATNEISGSRVDTPICRDKRDIGIARGHPDQGHPDLDRCHHLPVHLGHRGHRFAKRPCLPGGRHDQDPERP